MVSGHSVCGNSSCGVIDSIPASVPVSGNDCFACFLLPRPQSSLNPCCPPPALALSSVMEAPTCLRKKALSTFLSDAHTRALSDTAPGSGRSLSHSHFQASPQFLPQENSLGPPELIPTLPDRNFPRKSK